jgi:hypothetical protein
MQVRTIPDVLHLSVIFLFGLLLFVPEGNIARFLGWSGAASLGLTWDIIAFGGFIANMIIGYYILSVCRIMPKHPDFYRFGRVKR